MPLAQLEVSAKARGLIQWSDSSLIPGRLEHAIFDHYADWQDLEAGRMQHCLAQQCPKLAELGPALILQYHQSLLSAHVAFSGLRQFMTQGHLWARGPEYVAPPPAKILSGGVEAPMASDTTVETDTHVLFWKPPSAFDHWTPCEFWVDNFKFNCMEQFLMAEKARLCGDWETRELIMNTDDPAKQKWLASAEGPLRGFDLKLWKDKRWHVALRGNLAKYRYNKPLAERLVATGDKQLV